MADVVLILTVCFELCLWSILHVSPVAPDSEVIRGHGHSSSCDWWSLGVVIMLEYLFGSAF